MSALKSVSPTSWDVLPKTDRPLFFVRRSDRLTARLKHFLYAYRFARQVDGIVCVIWPDPPAHAKAFYGENYHPGLVFDLNAFRERGGANNLIFLPGKTHWSKGGPSLFAETYANFRNNRFKHDLFSVSNLEFYEDRLLNFSFMDEPRGREWMDIEVRGLFKSIPLNSEVSAIIEKIKNELNGREYSCVHFRAGDVYHMFREALPSVLDGSITESRRTLLLGHLVARTSPIEFYDEHVSKLIDEGRTILFSSDSPELLSAFEARYGTGRFVDLSAFVAPEPIQKAMVDFCMIGGSQTVFGSRGNFGAMAAMLGGAKMVIVSAAAVTSIPPRSAADLYHSQALDLLAADVPPDIRAMLHTEIVQHYTYLNRLGDKETLAALDPRSKLPKTSIGPD